MRPTTDPNLQRLAAEAIALRDRLADLRKQGGPVSVEAAEVSAALDNLLARSKQLREERYPRQS